MRVYYEWHFEELESYGDIIDFDYADTLDELFRNISPNKVKEMMDKQTHRLTIQKWDGADGDEQIVDYAIVDSVVTVRFSGDSGDGMQLTGTQFTTNTAIFGNDLHLK